MRLFKSTFYGFLLLALLAYNAEAKPTASLSQRQIDNIQYQARQTFEEFTRLLNFLANSETDETDISVAIERAFTTNLFFDREFYVDDDANPKNNTPGASTMKIYDYLNNFHQRVIGRNESSVKTEIISVSNVYAGEKNMFLRIEYNQSFNALSKDGQQFPKIVQKFMNIIVTPVGESYLTYINGIDFADKNRIITAPKVAVSADKDNTTVTRALKSEDYYSGIMQKAAEALDKGLYVDAYALLREAKESPQQADAASHLQTRLNAQMTSRGYAFKDYLSAELVQKAEELSRKYSYRDAIRYYNYAIELKPASSPVLAEQIAIIDRKQRQEQQLFALLEKGAYGQALTGFKAASDFEPGNPHFLIGLAKAYAGLGDDTSAAAAFKAAVNTGYAESLRELGLYQRQRGKYEAAYEAFASYQTKASDPGDKFTVSQMAYCKGRIFLNSRSYSDAQESFRASLKADPDNVESLVALAETLMRQGNIEEASREVDNALDRRQDVPEAWLLKSRILKREGRISEAIQACKTAVALDKNYRSLFELATLQMDKHKGDIDAAIVLFSDCLNLKPNDPQSLLMRGKCYYRQNMNREAARDFDTFYNNEIHFTDQFKNARTDLTRISDVFALEYANLLIRLNECERAHKLLMQIRQKQVEPRQQLSLGILYTLCTAIPGNADLCFSNAFSTGIAQEDIDNAPRVSEVVQKNPQFKKMMKEKNYRLSL